MTIPNSCQREYTELTDFITEHPEIENVSDIESLSCAKGKDNGVMNLNKRIDELMEKAFK